MSKGSPFRIILNMVLIVIAAISVVSTGFISIKEYHFNKIPEMYSKKQIVKFVQEKYSAYKFDKDKYPAYKFDKNDNWNVETHLADDNKTFIADVNIISTKDLCIAEYSVQITFKLIDGVWKAENLPGEITLTKNEWFFENSDWSVTVEDGTQYTVSFLSDLEVELYIQKSSDSTMDENVSLNMLNEDMKDDEEEDHEIYFDDSDVDENNMGGYWYGSNKEDVDLNIKDSNEMATCNLLKSDDSTFYTGNFKLSNNDSILLIVTEDSVKLKIRNEEVELSLTKV